MNILINVYNIKPEKLEIVLISIGYRKINDNTFAKPVAFNLFVFEIKELRWTNWFIGSNGEKLIWNTSIYETDDTVVDDFLNHIKYEDAYTRLSDRHSEFEFISLKEKLESIL